MDEYDSLVAVDDRDEQTGSDLRDGVPLVGLTSQSQLLDRSVNLGNSIVDLPHERSRHHEERRDIDDEHRTEHGNCSRHYETKTE
jgi:hypothetical protein